MPVVTNNTELANAITAEDAEITVQGDLSYSGAISHTCIVLASAGNSFTYNGTLVMQITSGIGGIGYNTGI